MLGVTQQYGTEKGILPSDSCLKPSHAHVIVRYLGQCLVNLPWKSAFWLAVKSKGGLEVLHKAEVHLKARHSAERILRCWGGQSKGSFDELKEGIHKMLQVCSLPFGRQTG